MMKHMIASGASPIELREYAIKNTEYEVTNHNYTVISETAPTCTENGIKVEKCTVCGNTKNTERSIVQLSSSLSYKKRIKVV